MAPSSATRAETTGRYNATSRIWSTCSGHGWFAKSRAEQVMRVLHSQMLEVCIRVASPLRHFGAKGPGALALRYPAVLDPSPQGVVDQHRSDMLPKGVVEHHADRLLVAHQVAVPPRPDELRTAERSGPRTLGNARVQQPLRYLRRLLRHIRRREHGDYPQQPQRCRRPIPARDHGHVTNQRVDSL